MENEDIKIGITGDTHGEDNIERFLMAERDKYTDLFITGDFGYIFFEKDVSMEETLDKINDLGIKIYFIDGNHENFNLLNNYPVSEFNGGKVQYIRPNIIHLMRGEIYDFNGTKIFALGGANSTDKMWRTRGLNWWQEELPSKEEREYALGNLSKQNNKVDLILTHTCYSQALKKLGAEYRIDEFTEYLETINQSVDYKEWYCGHMHTEKIIDKVHFMYENIQELIL